jgi:hypothetical protein
MARHQSINWMDVAFDIDDNLDSSAFYRDGPIPYLGLGVVVAARGSVSGAHSGIGSNVYTATTV